MKLLTLAAVVFILGLTSHVFAEDPRAEGHQHTPGMRHGKTLAEALPSEAGQSAFAAIQEIVAKLEADPATNWSTVNIEALRQHLIDMNSVALNADVRTEPLSDGRKFIVSGEGQVVLSIQRMLTGHAATINGGDAWAFSAETNASGASLTVKPTNAADLVKLDGLGFIGIMTMGMHHQEHHWMIAKGMHPH